MGCAFGSYLVWSTRTNRKIQSGFPSAAAARDYITDRKMWSYGWSVAQFTAAGVVKVLYQRPNPRPRLAPRPCENCKKNFHPDRRTQRFCKDDCRLIFHGRKAAA